MKHSLSIVAALLAMNAIAGPYDQPYALVVSEKIISADSHIRRPIINRVDDESIGSYPAVVAPGRHTIVLDLPPRKGFNTATQEKIELDLKPCTRYVMAARLETLTGQRWKPVVYKEEPLADCKKKFNIN